MVASEVKVITTIDSQGRIYLHERVRRVAGLSAGSMVEVTARPGEVIIRPVRSIARESRGVFRLKPGVSTLLKDVDAVAKKIQLLLTLRELRGES